MCLPSDVSPWTSASLAASAAASPSNHRIEAPAMPPVTLLPGRWAIWARRVLIHGMDQSKRIRSHPAGIEPDHRLIVARGLSQLDKPAEVRPAIGSPDHDPI